MYTNNVHKFDNNEQKENDVLERDFVKETNYFYVFSHSSLYYRQTKTREHAQLIFVF